MKNSKKEQKKKERKKGNQNLHLWRKNLHSCWHQITSHDDILLPSHPLSGESHSVSTVDSKKSSILSECVSEWLCAVENEGGNENVSFIDFLLILSSWVCDWVEVL